MSNYVTLMGAEDVSRAGHNMASAANDMLRAASEISSVLYLHQQFMQQWLCDFRDIVTSLKELNYDHT